MEGDLFQSRLVQKFRLFEAPLFLPTLSSSLIPHRKVQVAVERIQP